MPSGLPIGPKSVQKSRIKTNPPSLIVASSNTPILIAGAGIAGLSVALRLAPRPVIVLSGAKLGEGSASAWAQGGIAAALSEDDAPALHARDTVSAGAGLSDETRAEYLAAHAPQQIAWLEQNGVPFDRLDGVLALGREAAHGHNRIVHAGGDGTGAAIMRALIAKASATPSITLRAGARVSGLHAVDNKLQGVWLGEEYMPCAQLVLATGGVGQLYAHTTNPLAACGEGLAIAALAGAELEDLEFVQFHPTALAIGRDPMPLLTEALRGAGAVLINEEGERFMRAIHADAELAPRDVVARAIYQQLQAGHRPMLDARAALGKSFPQRFPVIAAVCAEAGLNPVTEPLPIAPAAHYHMGGIKVDDIGHSTLEGLWACGEVACTRIHGANRLASNSLLEALVYAEALAEAMPNVATPTGSTPRRTEMDQPVPATLRTRLRRRMYAGLGLVRDAEGMQDVLKEIATLLPLATGSSAAQHMLLVAGMMAAAGLARRESRGAHSRTDYPKLAARAEHGAMNLKRFRETFANETSAEWPESAP